MFELINLPAFLFRVRYGIICSILLAMLFSIAVVICWPLLPEQIYNHSSKNPGYISKGTLFTTQVLIIACVGSLMCFLVEGRRSITPTGIKVFRPGSVSVGAISLAWTVGFSVVLYGEVTRSNVLMDPKVIIGLVISVLVCVGIAALDAINDE